VRSKADAVIIGGGIIGMATAFYLARAKYGRVVLLEKESLTGTQSTSKAAGGIRAQFANKANIQMSMLSEKLFCHFKEDTGQEAFFDQVGYMFLLTRDDDAETFTKSADLQRSLGLKVEILKPADIPQYAPATTTAWLTRTNSSPVTKRRPVNWASKSSSIRKLPV
jgi:sarcosine oxidase subunit beta